MKRLMYISLAMFMLGASSCGGRGQSKNNVDSESSQNDSVIKRTSVRFDVVEQDLGTVKEGEKVFLKYEATNTGKADLLLQKVAPSCGCTTPKYEKQPIRPGKKGVIEVTFDTKNRSGKQRKTIMVTTNTEPPNTVLAFTCEILPAENK